MAFQTRGELRYYQFDGFDRKISQAFLTRRGGVSPEPWASLNLGGTVGDDPERVRENRRRALVSLGRNPEEWFDVWQVHGVNVAIAKRPHHPDLPHVHADVILSDEPGLTLMMRFADCVPIFLHDPVRKVIGIAHAGWKGTVLGVAQAAVDAMHAQFGSKPADLLAGIGPSIGPDHYEIGMDVVDQVERAFGADASGLLAGVNGRKTFDLWAANRLRLEQAGIKHIEVSEICTACHNDDWFSHRAEHGRTGRFGAILALS
jgi:polyphenol oxidase